LTKHNKEIAEKTNMTIKYPEQTAYVKGEAENSLVLKVNDVSDSTLK
jgi:hypothetical protein